MDSLKNACSAYWPLGEASGTRDDVVSGAVSLAPTGTPGRVNGVQVGAAAFVAASTQGLSVASNARLQAGDTSFTFATWVNLTSKPAGIGEIFNKYGVSAGQPEYLLFWSGSAADRFNMYVYRPTDTPVTVTANSFGAPALATWYFLVGWHDADLDTVNIQINNGTIDSTATGGALQAASTGAFGLGMLATGGQNFDGSICEGGIWRRVLAAQEKSWLYNNGKGRTYPFDGRNGPDILSKVGRQIRTPDPIGIRS